VARDGLDAVQMGAIDPKASYRIYVIRIVMYPIFKDLDFGCATIRLDWGSLKRKDDEKWIASVSQM
jgi:hypothetical protein